MTWITSAIHTTSKGCSLCLHQYPRRVHLYQWGCISLLLFASPPRAFSQPIPKDTWPRRVNQRSILQRISDSLLACTSTPEEFISTSGAASLFSSLHAFSFKSPSWWRGLPQRSIPRPKDSLCLHQYPRRVHLYQWGCISLLLFASPPRAFSFKSPSWWRGLPQRSIPRPKDVLFACTSTPEEFISTSGAASLFSSLHLLRVHSLLNPHPDDVDYLSDPYHIQRMFSLLAPVPQKSSSLPVGLHLSSPLCISSACILF